MAKKENNKEKNNKLKYGLYAAMIAIIVIIAFLVGTAVGFTYARNDKVSCRPIECPGTYQCQPGQACSFQKCELCADDPVLKLTHGE